MYGKEITLTLEDALISFESLRIMLGGKINKASANKKVTVHLTEQANIATANTVPTLYDHLNASISYDISKVAFKYINLTTGERGRIAANAASTAFKAAVGDNVRFFWTQEVDNEDKAVEITISPNTFPGSYKIVGDTFIRSAETNADEAFQFVINKAKVNSEVTISLEAEGDPSTNIQMWK